MKSKVTLSQGECLNLMSKMPDACVDLILCDLPYGTTQNKWDAIIDPVRMWKEYKRICTGAIVLTAAQPFTSILVCSNLKDFKYQWVWQKEAGTGLLNAKKQPLRDHEDVLVFYSKQPVYNPQMTVGKPYTCKKGGETTNYNPSGSVVTVNTGTRCPKTVLQFQRDKSKVHPTQKPVALMEYMVKTYTNEGMTVLDNCIGSGTTGVACVNLVRHFIGMEQDPQHFATAKQRIKEAQGAKR